MNFKILVMRIVFHMNFFQEKKNTKNKDKTKIVLTILKYFLNLYRKFVFKLLFKFGVLMLKIKVFWK